MVIAMADLGFAARMDDVDLGCNTAGGAKPGFADQSQPGVRVVGHEGLWGVEAVLLERVPDARVSAAGEVITTGVATSDVGADDACEGIVDAIKQRLVGVEVFEDNDARTGEQDLVPFVLKCVGGIRIIVGQDIKVIDGNVRLNGIGKGTLVCGRSL